MFENSQLGPEVLSNPSATQYLFIKELEARIGGYYSIADANNGFCFLGEYGSSLCAQSVREMTASFRALYAKRAQNAEDLSAFISDYDIFNMTAAPATCNFRMLIPVDWIKQTAVPYNSTYNIIEYPAQSVFKFAGKAWTMYYPIQILYNPSTGNIVAYYNTDTTNNLLTLPSNLLPDTHFEWHDGNQYLSVTFPVYQFYRQSILTTAVAATTGFNRSFTYSNKFYAVQISTLLNGSWVELSYALSEQVYDTSTVTALLTIDNDNGILGVRIPQVYFTNGLVGTQVKVDILTTEGNISFTVTDTDSINIQADFKPDTSTYSSMLGVNQGSILMPGYNQSVVTGGADPMDFTTLRSAVIRNALHDTALVSNMQLSVAVAKYGYTLTEYLDNITNRVYYASSPINDNDASRLVPVIVSPVIINPTLSLPSSVKVPGDGSITIMPNTIFSYNSTTGMSTLLDDATVNSFATLSKQQLCDALNKAVYTRQPYHIWLNTQAGSPQAKSFNLLNPSLTSLYVTGENNTSTILSSVVAIVISHDNGGTGGYTITLEAVRTTSMTNDQLVDMVLLVQFYDRTGNLITTVAKYIGSDTTSGRDIYQVHLATTYQLSVDGYIQCSIPQYDGTTATSDIPLNLSIVMNTLVATSAIPTAVADPTLNTTVPIGYLSEYMVISAQTAVLSLGQDISDIVNTNVTTTWGDPVYQTWNVNVPYLYSSDLYLRNTDGSLALDMSSGQPNLVKIASAGSPIPVGSDTTIDVSQTATQGQQALTVANVTGLVPNMLLRGLNISPGTYIQSISGNTLTLSQPLLGDVPLNAPMVAKNTFIQQTLPAVAKGANTITLDTTNLVTGMVIVAVGIPSGTTITVSKGSITLSNATTTAIASGASVVFQLVNGPVAYRYKVGDIKRDAYGNPIEAAVSTNTYGVTITQFDERLYRSEAVSDQNYAASIPAWFNATAQALDPVRSNLLEQTKLYYRPYRTMGLASFTGGNDITYQLPLEMSFTITYYVTLADKNNAAKQKMISDSTLSLVNTYLQSGQISVPTIANTLKTAFSGMVLDVDVSGIDNGTNKVLAITTGGAIPSVAYTLDVADDGSLAYTPDLTIIFETAPTAAISSNTTTQTSV